MPIIEKIPSEMRVQEFYTVINLQTMIVVKTFKEAQVKTGYRMLRVLLGDRYKTPEVKSFKSRGRFIQIENWSFKYAVIITKKPLNVEERQIIDLSLPMLNIGNPKTGTPSEFIRFLHNTSIAQVRLQNIIATQNDVDVQESDRLAKKFTALENYYILEASNLEKYEKGEYKSNNVALPRILKRLKREIGAETIIQERTFKYRGIPITIQNFGNKYIIIITPFAKKLNFLRDRITGDEVLNLNQLKGTQPDAIQYIKAIQVMANV